MATTRPTTQRTTMERLNRAKAALAAAETKQGLRHTTHHTPTTRLTLLTQPDAPPTTSAETITGTPHTPHQPTAQTPNNQLNATATLSDAAVPSHIAAPITKTNRTPLPIHPALHPLLPHGLKRGAITHTTGSTTTALTLISQHTNNGGWAAIIGAPHINYTAAHDLGINLNNLIVIPHPGDKTPEIIAALIEGLDLILLGPATTLTPKEQRNLTARARERGTHIITQNPWTTARTHITTTHTTWHGPHNGTGRLTAATHTLTNTTHHTTTTTTLTTTNGTPTTTNKTPTTQHHMEHTA